MTKATTAAKAKKESEIVEVADIEMEITSETTIESEIVEETPEVEVVVESEAPAKIKNVLLHRFTQEDVTNKNPELMERLYKTFEPMGIHADRDQVFDLMEFYFDWYASRQEELKAEEERKRKDAMERIQKLAQQAGLEVQVA
jgi:3'-phosphoadenosine 5'-phosphosulfate (PAPS) 3'-phosphatase